MPWLLLDVDFPYPAFVKLRDSGRQVLHAGEEGLAAFDDQQLFEYAIEDGCVVVTRNYLDFARLAEAYSREGRDFPGILFLSDELSHGDLEGHVRAVERWLSSPDSASDVRNRYVWVA